MTPVIIGSAYKNKGVQLLLDGVVDYLPNPTEVTNEALDQNKNEEKVILAVRRRRSRSSAWRSSWRTAATASSPTCASTRARSPRATSSSTTRRTSKQGQGAAPRAHALGRDERHRRRPRRATSSRCSASTAPRATRSPTATINYTMTSMHVPDAVISLAVTPKDKATARPTSPRRSTASPRKTRPSACTATRSRRRPSSPAWASSTSRSTSSA